MNYGFVKVASAIPSLKVADCSYNIQQIESLIIQAEGKGVEIIVFPELCISGYTCGDLFGQQLLLEKCEESLFKLLDFTRSLQIIAIVGMPVMVGGLLMNCAVVVQGGKILGVVPKTFLPNCKEFYEQRWFAPATAVNETQIHLCAQPVTFGRNLLFHTQKTTFGIELCEDLWAPIPPSCELALKGAEIIFNLSASNELIGKNQYLLSLISQQSARCIAGYVYSSCGFGESTQDVVVAGNALIYENGTLIARSKRFSLDEQMVISEIDTERLLTERRHNTTFSENVRLTSNSQHTDILCQTVNPVYDFELTRWINPHPFVPRGAALDERCEEIFSIQTSALAKRIVHTNSRSIVLGISGGLDSTLALLVCVKTMDLLKRPRKEVIGVTMPGFGTTDRTYNNAIALMKSLDITIKEISIKEACIQHFKDINHDINVHDVTYENGQARERTQILMDVANQCNGFVVGTGDLSELALGWCTYNADHMSMYSVNCDIPKTLVRYIVSWYSTKCQPQQMVELDTAGTAKLTLSYVLQNILNTPVSPELLPADKNGQIVQKTEDILGSYDIHDFYLYHFVKYGATPAKMLYLADYAFRDYANQPGYTHEALKKALELFLRRFFTQQFKRSCIPDGPKVGTLSLSPRADWRMPSDASFENWIASLNQSELPY